MRELGNLPEKLAEYSLRGVPLYHEETRGLSALDAFWDDVYPLKKSKYENRESKISTPQSAIRNPKSPIANPHSALHKYQTGPFVEVPAALPSPEMTLFLFAGKGGVGKTTLACATALRMACELGDKEVFLFSTDPAHSLSACLDTPVGPKPTRLTPGLTAMEIDSQSEFQTLKDQYAEELEGFLSAISPNLDLTFDREVMERIMDLSPPGLDEVMALTMAIEFLAQRQYDVFILDSAPTGHLIRLLELPELIDRWLKTFFGLFLKYKQVFRLPKVSQRLVQISRELKYLRSMLHDPKRSALYAVTILTEMAFQETKDLLDTCKRMGVNAPVLFLNLATPLSECPFCSALYHMESKLKDKFDQNFLGIHQTTVYRQGEPRGLDRLGELGEVLYRPKGKVGIEGFGN
jgi:arsenite-transporting ATPase